MVLRAAVMAAAGIAGFLLGRVDRPVHLVALAALVLLVVEPGGLFQAGFQMSFAATLGLALGMPAVERMLRQVAAGRFWPKAPWARKVLAGSARLLAASVLAQLALAITLLITAKLIDCATDGTPTPALSAEPLRDLGRPIQALTGNRAT